MNIEDRIAKLLEKAESERALGNSEAGDAYSAKAEELMLRHGITEAKRHDAQAGDNFTTVYYRYDGTYARTHMEGLYSVVLAGGLVKMFWSKDYRGRGGSAGLVGTPADTAQLRRLAGSLHAQAETALGQWWTQNRSRYVGYTPREQLIERRTFLAGFYRAVATRVRELKATIVAEEGAGTDLVLVSQMNRIEKYAADAHALRSRAVRARAAGGMNAYVGGHVAGARADINQTHLTK